MGRGAAPVSSRTLGIVLGFLVAVMIGTAGFLLFSNRDKGGDASLPPGRSATGLVRVAGSPSAPSSAPAPAGWRSAGEREAFLAQVREPERTKALAAVAADARAPGAQRIEAMEALAAAKVSPEVLFPLAVRFSEEQEPVFRGVAVEVTASLLAGGEKVGDEDKAAAILIDAAKPESNGSLRRAAARGLGGLRSKAAAGALVGLLADKDRLTRKLALEGLKGLSGEAFGYDYAAEPGGQKEAIARWAQWAGTYAPEAR